MCGRCCICKTCCCGQTLKDGVFIWALADILFHILVFPLPLLVADLVFFAPTFDLWLFFVIFADIVLMLGEKSGKPALLTLWLVIFFINIVGLFLMWVALGISIYLISQGMELPFLTRVDELKDITGHPFWLVMSLISLVLMATVPFFHAYFWMVVWSLRKRYCMEIAISFNPEEAAGVKQLQMVKIK